MGAHSTISITRTTARQYLLSHILRMSDCQLERMMDAELYDRLYNCRIVGDDDENDDDRLNL